MANRSLRWQNAIVVIASYIFYGWWDWRFLLLIIGLSFCGFLTALGIERCRGRASARVFAVTNIVVSLCVLGTFKYFNFFAANLQSLLLSFGIHPDMPTLKVILPVGISFYTFQSLSYTIDVWRGRVRATTDVLAFFAYICFFPQLVAGPIERATSLLPQMLSHREFSYTNAVDGLRQMLWGFFKKMVVADNCALAVNTIFGCWHECDALMLFAGMVFFAVQIYGDFSGYSDIAIGTAQLFGIRLNDNFRTPYFSRSFAEFWQRWHISLMRWFRDYVYIPLGGNRRGRITTLRNVFLVFLLSGLWHGANWTFVLWGAYSALFFIPSIFWRDSERREMSSAKVRDLPRIFLVFLLVSVGWVIFRSDNIYSAWGYLSRMFWLLDKTDTYTLTVGKGAIMWSIFLFVVEWMQREKRHAMQIPSYVPVVVRWLIYYTLLAFILFCHGQEQVFIYFQF